MTLLQPGYGEGRRASGAKGAIMGRRNKQSGSGVGAPGIIDSNGENHNNVNMEVARDIHPSNGAAGSISDSVSNAKEDRGNAYSTPFRGDRGPTGI